MSPECCIHNKSSFLPSVLECYAAFTVTGTQPVSIVPIAKSFLVNSFHYTCKFNPFHSLIGLHGYFFFLPCYSLVITSPKNVLTCLQGYNKNISGILVHNWIRVKKRWNVRKLFPDLSPFYLVRFYMFDNQRLYCFKTLKYRTKPLFCFYLISCF